MDHCSLKHSSDWAREEEMICHVCVLPSHPVPVCCVLVPECWHDAIEEAIPMILQVSGRQLHTHTRAGNCQEPHDIITIRDVLRFSGFSGFYMRYDSICDFSVPNILLTICLLQRDKRVMRKLVLTSHGNKSAENKLSPYLKIWRRTTYEENYLSFGAGTDS